MKKKYNRLIGVGLGTIITTSSVLGVTSFADISKAENLPAITETTTKEDKTTKTTTERTTKATTEKETEIKTTERTTEAATEKKTEAATEKETEKVSSEEASSEEVSSEKASSEEASSEAASKETEAKADENAKVRVIDIDLTSEQYAFGVDKEQPELLEKTNEFIAKIMEDGTFDEICNHYFGDGEPVMVKSAEYDESKDQLVVATNAGFEPFEYMKGEDYCGIDMEMAALLADYLGKELVIQNMDFDAVCLAVGQQKCDIAMAGLTITESRKDQVTFTDSYYNASQKLIVAADDTTFDACKTKEDVEAIFKTFDSKTKVGAQNGTTAQFYVEGSEDLDFAGFDMTLVGYKNGSLAVQDLLNGNLDYVIIDAAPAESITAAINSL